MAEIKFYQDAAHNVQVYPEINPDGNYPGVTVGLANNLTSPDGTKDTDTWQYRSSGGDQDISDGYAELQKLIGTTQSSTITESLTYNLLATGVKAVSITKSTFKSRISTSGTYDFIYTPVISYSSPLIYALNKSTFANNVNKTTGTYNFVYSPEIARQDSYNRIASFNASTFAAKVGSTVGTYEFTYDGSAWKLNGSVVTLSQYGITTTGSEQSGNTFIIYYTSNSWFYNNNAVNMSSYGITTTGTEVLGDTLSISYTANQWQLNGSAVTLSQYGISISSGTAAIDDDIQVVFVAQQTGVVLTSNPTGLYSIGLNQFDYEGTHIFPGYTISSAGKIQAGSGSYVIYFKCLGNKTYTIYNTLSGKITRAAYSANVPTTSSTGLTVLSTVSTASSGQTVTNDNYQKHYQASANGYMCVAVTDIENLCCHLTWSGYNDTVYETYTEFTLPIPYVDVNGNTISDYGLAKLDNTYYDEIDFAAKKWHKRTTRIEYTAENLAMVQALHVAYVYDNNYIYYGVAETVYDIADITYTYKVSDFGTEEFIGSSVNLTPTIFYQSNLKDKLRRSVEVIENKVERTSINASHDEYLSAKGSYDLDKALRHILGLDIDTFSTSKTYAVGDYVVYQGKLWKCIKAVTSAGSWKGNGLIINTNDGMLLDIDTTKFVNYITARSSTTPWVEYNSTYGTYQLWLPHPNDSDMEEFSSIAALEAATGLVVSTKGSFVQFNYNSSNAYWEESYLFKA